MRTLKRPKLIFNIKYMSKINIKNFKHNMFFSNINHNLMYIKKEFSNINNEIAKLQNSLLKIKNDYGYLYFIEIETQQNLLARQKAYEKIYDLSTTNKLNNEPTTKALTVVKTRFSFKYFKNNKKSS